MKNKFNKAELVVEILTRIDTNYPNLEKLKEHFDYIIDVSETLKFLEFEERFLRKTNYHKAIKNLVKMHFPSNKELGKTKIKDRMIAIEIVASHLTSIVFSTSLRIEGIHEEVIPTEMLFQNNIIHIESGDLDHIFENDEQKEELLKLIKCYI